MNRSGPGQLVGLAFVVVVVVAIVALLAGYGVPVGVGALAGFILGGDLEGSARCHYWIRKGRVSWVPVWWAGGADPN